VRSEPRRHSLLGSGRFWCDRWKYDRRQRRLGRNEQRRRILRLR
jgi:hypothetical protein